MDRRGCDEVSQHAGTGGNRPRRPSSTDSPIEGPAMTTAASRARRATGMALPLNAVSADILQAELEQMATAILAARDTGGGDGFSHSAAPGPVEEARVRFLR